MIKSRYLQVFHLLVIFSLIILQSSCEKFEGTQTIPAYISIDSILLKIDDPDLQGSASHNITDAWVFIDDVSIGAYQLPACFPVLFEGNHKLTVLAGIKRNGIGSTRVTYPFFASISQPITLVPEDTVKIPLLNAHYESTAVFDWKEDFEGVTLSLDSTKQSSVNLQTTTSQSPLTFEGSHSGIIRLDKDHQFFEIKTHDQFPIPANKPIYLEMNFKTNLEFTVGAMIYGASYVTYQVPILNLVPTKGVWKKIYIDLSVTLNAYTGANQYRIYFSNITGQDFTDAEILFDNLKVVTR